MLSDLAIGYLFLGGAASGLLVLLCALEYANGSRLYVTRFSLPVDFFQRAWVVCVAAFALSLFLLVADLGLSERALLVLFLPTFSPLTVGAYALAISLCIAAVFCGLSLTSLEYAATIPLSKMKGVPRSTDRPARLSRVLHALELLGALAGCIAMLYTGIMLSTMPSVVAWSTPLLPLLFVLSSLSCGIALAFLAAAFTESRQTFFQTLRRITGIDTVLIGVEAIVFAAYLAWCIFCSATPGSGWQLLSGELAPWIWLGLAALGLVAPVLLERLITRQNYRTQLMWIAGGVLVGGFALRYCVAALAVYDPSAAYTVALAAA